MKMVRDRSIGEDERGGKVKVEVEENEVWGFNTDKENKIVKKRIKLIDK